MTSTSTAIKSSSKKNAFSVIFPYWKSSEKWGAWTLLGLLIVLLFIRTALQVVFLIYGGELTSALAAQDNDRFFQAALIFAAILVISVPFASVTGYVRAKLGLYWRTWLTHDYLNQYLANQSFYQLRLQGNIDNPDQRIEEDVRTLTQESLKLFEIALESGFQLIGFAGLLWAISQPLMLFLVIYSVVGSAIAFLFFGRPLIRINSEQLKREADFRYDLTRIRENTEAIALYRGESQELTQSQQQFTHVFNNFTQLIHWQLGLNLFQNHYRYATFIIPGIILAPRLFAGELEIGDVTQAGSAFTFILSALALIALQLQQLTKLSAATQRLQQLTTAFPPSATSSPSTTESIQPSTLQPSSIPSATVLSETIPSTNIQIKTGPTLIIKDLSLTTPDGKKQLIQNLSFSLPERESLLITGPSGVGKSSLLRAIAGLWQSGTGTIICPVQIAFIPQCPYLPNCTLQDNLLYPFAQTTPPLLQNSTHQTESLITQFSKAALTETSLKETLEQVNLPTLAKHDLNKPLVQPLSLGEQQRLSFARLLLHRPQYAILDEATSALDLNNEAQLYQLLPRNSITPISVGHRPSLKQYHHHTLTLAIDGSCQYHKRA